MAAKFTINGRPPGARLELLEEAVAIGRYTKQVLTQAYGDQAPFLAQISDMVAGAVDKALRDLSAPLPKRLESFNPEGLRNYAMPARTAEEARATPAENEDRPVPGGVAIQQDVGNAFLPGYSPPGDVNNSLERVSVEGPKPFSSEDEWLT